MRLEGDRFVPWKGGADSMWRSSALGVAFRATQPPLTILDHAGQEIPTVGTLHRLPEEERRQREEERRQLAEERRQLAEERQRRLAEEERRRRPERHETGNA